MHLSHTGISLEHGHIILDLNQPLFAVMFLRCVRHRAANSNLIALNLASARLKTIKFLLVINIIPRCIFLVVGVVLLYLYVLSSLLPCLATIFA